MPLIVRLALFLCLFFSARAAPAQGAGGEIGMQTFPLLKQVRPLAEPVRTVLIILDSNGRALKKGTAHIRLVAPAPGRFFSTDFPVIEGTPLLEMDLPILQGRAAWEYLFPIRGVYRLEVRAVAEEGTGIERVFDLEIRENRMKLFYLAIFALALFVFGIMAGRLFTGGKRGL
ncbi:MAG: hypothetical protein HYY83_10835 [Deltaproteobacteria bacterium]|nr:hypothetical protein [Deltaproteobacteria bacterium]MBI3062456.1 hypothetical protein [Deltaproteobacteria bacterium]